MQWELSASPGSISLKWFGFLVNPWLSSRGHGFVFAAWADVVIEANDTDAIAITATITSRVIVFIFYLDIESGFIICLSNKLEIIPVSTEFQKNIRFVCKVSLDRKGKRKGWPIEVKW